MRWHKSIRRKQQGFTIIELMIATAVLSTILLLVTVMMINIGHLYYKGFNQSRIQDGVRGISDDLARHLQLSDGATTAINGATRAYCIGSTRYTYVLYEQISSAPAAGQSRHVLWRDTNPTPGSCSITGVNGVNLNVATPSIDPGTELITPSSRLTSFCISGSVANSCIPDKSPYTISVGAAYGDSDLLCDSGSPGDCSSPNPSTHLTSPSGQILCKGRIGDQFCAATYLNITVVQRLTGS